jgi:hypothetical protein
LLVLSAISMTHLLSARRCIRYTQMDCS